MHLLFVMLVLTISFGYIYIVHSTHQLLCLSEATHVDYDLPLNFTVDWPIGGERARPLWEWGG